MLESEIIAVSVADKHKPFEKGEKGVEKKLKHLAEEVMELAMAIAKDDAENRNEEIGDCLFLILHIASHFNREKSLLEYIDEAKDKMIEKHKLSNKVKK